MAGGMQKSGLSKEFLHMRALAILYMLMRCDELAKWIV